MNLDRVLGVDAASENVDGKPDNGAPTDPSIKVEGDVVTDTVPPCDGVSRRDPNEHDEVVFIITFMIAFIIVWLIKKKKCCSCWLQYCCYEEEEEEKEEEGMLSYYA